MDQQQSPMTPPQPVAPAPVAPEPAPVGVPMARLEPIGETWASGVGPTRLGTRSGKFRWAIALGIVLIVALVTVGGAFVLSGAGGAAKSLTAGNAPKSTLMFVDLRTDLPGDQHQKLADFMSHFPGFKDRAQFDNAYDEILNQVTSRISPDLTYTSAFKGWTTGEISVALTSMGGAGTGVTSSAGGAVIVALKDRAAGEAWVTSEIARTGMTFTSQDYAGTKLFSATQAGGGLAAAYAFTDKVLLLGTIDAVKAGLDAPAKGSLADNTNYQAAMHALSGDSVTTFYVDTQAILQQATAMSGAMSSVPMVAGMSLDSVDMTKVPAWAVGSVRAESDHMTVEITVPQVKGATSQGNRESALAEQLPGSTVGVIEIRSIGQLLAGELKTLSSTPGMASSMKQIQDALTQIGGVDWIGDGDAVLTRDGSSFGGGLVVKTTDSATAATKKAMITNLLAFAGGSLGLKSADETYKGTTITMVSASNDVSGVPVQVGIAVKGDMLVAGYGDSFVKAVLDTTASSSLAAQPGYKAVMAAVGSSNTEYGYFDISAVTDQIGHAMFPANPGFYDLNYKPYLDHVGGAAFAAIDGSTVTLRFIVTAK